MRYDFAVFGATGLQGKIVVRDLIENGHSVLMCGRDKARVEDYLKKYKKTGFAHIDAHDINGMASVLKSYGVDVVVNCVEDLGWNYVNISKACLKAGAHCVDLGSEKPVAVKQFAMHDDLKKAGLILLTGCGSVPGVGNVMLRHAAEKFDTIHTIKSGYNWKSNMNRFVVPFSIQSVIEEFMDPNVIVKDGKQMVINPMDTVTFLYRRGIGKQKSFSERHPENYTFFKYYKHKGLKNVMCYAGFPQHSFDRIQKLIELGFGSRVPVNFRGTMVPPIEFLTEVLKRVKVPEGYKETENLWVHLYGKKNGKAKVTKMETVVHTLKGWEDAYTNIDTGMPASIIAQMIKKEIIKDRGAYSPEGTVPTEHFFKELRKRSMSVYENGELIN